MIINPYRFAAAGFGNSSRDFVDSESDYLAIGSSTASYNFIHEDALFSIAFWMKLDNQATSEITSTIMASTPSSSEIGFRIFYDNRAATGTDTLRLFINHGSVGNTISLTVANAIVDTNWHHVVFTGDGSASELEDVKLYIDGSQLGSSEMNGSFLGAWGDATRDLNIGRYNLGTPGDYFDGHLADIRIYDYKLSASRVSDIYGGSEWTTGLVSHWIKNADSTTDYGTAGKDFTNNGTDFSTDGPLD